MSFAQILHLLVAILTIVVGLASVVLPKVSARFTGFGENVSPRGMSEVRSVIGGAFVGLGVAPLVLGNAYVAYQVMGITYLAIGLVRALSMAVLDRDTSQSSIISVVSEFVFAAILLLLQP